MRVPNPLSTNKGGWMRRSGRQARRLAAAAVNLDIQVADFLPQRIAVQTEQVGRADLVAAGRRQRRGQKRHLDLLEDAVIEAGRRYAIGKAREVRRQIRLDRPAEIVDAMMRAASGIDCG